VNARELIIYVTVRQNGNLFRAARSLPADRLDWQPSPGRRSALDQIQECATALDLFIESIQDRKLEWTKERYGRWLELRGQYAALDDLERVCGDNTQRWAAYVHSLRDDELDEPVELPFPGEFKLVDLLMYQYWNASYHEGQIEAIRQELPQP
jgi:uncharacterized damage-inducible protein DinB